MQVTTTTAPIWRRFLAWLVDAVVLSFFTAATIYVLVTYRSLAGAVVIAILEGLYKPVMEANYGWTLGKRALKIQVIDAQTGGPIDFNQSLMRYLPWAITVFAGIWLLDQYLKDPAFAEVLVMDDYMPYLRNSAWTENTYLGIIRQLPVFSSVWMVGDQLRQALHDKLAGTIVVNAFQPVTNQNPPTQQSEWRD